MISLGGTAKAYILLVTCVYSMKFITIEGLEGDSRSGATEENGQTSSYFFYHHRDYPRDCRDVRDRCSTSSEKLNGTYLIKPEGYLEPFEVFCNNEIDSGGWTLVLRRSDGSLSFKRNWEDYKSGFGFLSNEHWLGNEKLSYLTNQADYELQIDFVLSNGSFFYVKYNSFRISDERSEYVLVSSGTYSGNASYGMYYTSGRLFSTFDEDNDGCGKHNCAEKHRGAWWYNPETPGWCSQCYGIHCCHFQYSSSCRAYCTDSNLNGDYNGVNGENIFWGYNSHLCTLNSAEMKLRPLV